MKKMLKNSEVFERLHSLKPLLSRRDRIGYIAARNYRFLSNSLVCLLYTSDAADD